MLVPVPNSLVKIIAATNDGSSRCLAETSLTPAGSMLQMIAVYERESRVVACVNKEWAQAVNKEWAQAFICSRCSVKDRRSLCIGLMFRTAIAEILCRFTVGTSSLAASFMTGAYGTMQHGGKRQRNPNVGLRSLQVGV